MVLKVGEIYDVDYIDNLYENLTYVGYVKCNYEVFYLFSENNGSSKLKMLEKEHCAVWLSSERKNNFMRAFDFIEKIDNNFELNKMENYKILIKLDNGKDTCLTSAIPLVKIDRKNKEFILTSSKARVETIKYKTREENAE